MAQFLLTEILGLPTLGLIISDISQAIFEILVPIWQQISWIFGNTPNILYWNGFEGSYGQKTQNSEIRKYAILSQPRKLTFFVDEIFQFFSYPYGSKVPKWNCAHILLWEKSKN